MKKVLFVVFCLALFGCNKIKVNTEKPEIYEPSELASLMRKMEAENQMLKEQIEKGKDSFSFPSAYAALNTSEPTQEGTINNTYKSFSAAYTLAMDALQHGDSNIVYRYNKGIEACVNCHNQFCGGPIVRIEKLFIQQNPH